MADRRALWTLYFVVFTDFMQLNLTMPLFPAIIASFGGDEALLVSKVAILTTVGNTAEAIGSPIIGLLADRFGRKLSLMVAGLGAAVAAAAFGFAGNFSTALAARVILGFCGNTLSVAQAMATDLTTEAERPDAISKLQAGLSLGLTFGPALGGFLFSFLGVKFTCLAGSTVSVINSMFVYFFLQETVPDVEQKQRTETQEQEEANGHTDVEAPQATAAEAAESTPAFPCKTWFLFLAFFLFSPFITVLESFGVLYLSNNYCSGNVDQATRMYSLTFASFGLAMFVMSFFCYGAISKYLGFNWTLVTGGILASGGMLLITLAPHSWGLLPFLFGMMILAAGFQLSYPAVPDLIGKLVSPEYIGRAFGINNTMSVLARVLGPIGFTPLFSWWNESIWLISAALILASTTITLAVSSSITGGEKPVREVGPCKTAARSEGVASEPVADTQ